MIGALALSAALAAWLVALRVVEGVLSGPVVVASLLAAIGLGLTHAVIAWTRAIALVRRDARDEGWTRGLRWAAVAVGAFVSLAATEHHPPPEMLRWTAVACRWSSSSRSGCGRGRGDGGR